MAGEPFEWGWEALVAIGTLALAFATVLLAWSTRRMARATAQDVASQWRPAVAPGRDAEVYWEEDDHIVYMAVRNVGRGAAYYVDAALDLGRFVLPAAPWSRSGDEPRNFAVLPADEETYVHFTHVDEPPGTCELIIDYEDLIGSHYSTRIEIGYLPTWYPDRRPTGALQMTRAELLSGRELLPWKPPGPWGRLNNAIRARRRQRELERSRRDSNEEEPDPF